MPCHGGQGYCHYHARARYEMSSNEQVAEKNVVMILSDPFDLGDLKFQSRPIAMK